MTADQAAAQAARVLIVRLDEIGDMVMFTPFLRGLRQRLPGAHVTLVVKPAVRNLAERCPYVDEVLTYDHSARRLVRPLVLPVRAWFWARRHLGPGCFDLAILPRWDADYYYATFLLYFSGARWRVGYSEKVNRHRQEVNRGFDRLFTHVLDVRGVKHDIAHNLDMLRFLGADAADGRTEVWTGPEDEAFAEALLRDHGVGPDDALIGLGPAGGYSPLKQWPSERFVALGERLQRTHGARILLFGGPGEEELGREISARLGPGAVSLIGRTTLRQMAALMARCRVYVGNDSGPTHIAAATGAPVVAIFGSSCRHRFHPAGRGRLVWRELPCGPCRQGHERDRCKRCIFDQPRCLTDISVEEVAQAVAHSLSDGTLRCEPLG